METIKVKIWTDEEMLGPFDLSQNPKYWASEMKDGVVLLSTGLKDKNGDEIYDGDILTDFGDVGPLYVEFSTEHAGFVFMDKFDNGPPSYTPKEISYEQFKIIGNIYENPELLQEETK